MKTVKNIFKLVIYIAPVIIIAVTLAGITYMQPEYPKIIKQDNTAIKRVYLLCRRPLHYLDLLDPLYPLLLKRNYTVNSLDNLYEHHHFFLVDNSIDLNEKTDDVMDQIWKSINSYNSVVKNQNDAKFDVYDDLKKRINIDESCEKNNFQNFGFFNNNKIVCNENIQDYSECHRTKFDESTMKKAIAMMRRDKVTYNLYLDNQYNCQTFTKHMTNAYGITKENMGPMCANTYSEHDSSTLNKIKNNIAILFGINIKEKNSKFNYDWGINPYYESK